MPIIPTIPIISRPVNNFSETLTVKLGLRLSQLIDVVRWPYWPYYSLACQICRKSFWDINADDNIGVTVPKKSFTDISTFFSTNSFIVGWIYFSSEQHYIPAWTLKLATSHNSPFSVNSSHSPFSNRLPRVFEDLRRINFQCLLK